MTVEVKRVVHHGVVDQLDADDLPFFNGDDAVFRKRFAVERPDVAFHVAGCAEGDGAAREIGREFGGFEGAEAGVGGERPLGFVGKRLGIGHRLGFHVVHPGHLVDGRHHVVVHVVGIRFRDIRRGIFISLT